jgi:hypothetical protein
VCHTPSQPTQGRSCEYSFIGWDQRTPQPIQRCGATRGLRASVCTSLIRQRRTRARDEMRELEFLICGSLSVLLRPHSNSRTVDNLNELMITVRQPSRSRLCSALLSSRNAILNLGRWLTGSECPPPAPPPLLLLLLQEHLQFLLFLFLLHLLLFLQDFLVEEHQQLVILLLS